MHATLLCGRAYSPSCACADRLQVSQSQNLHPFEGLAYIGSACSVCLLVPVSRLGTLLNLKCNWFHCLCVSACCPARALHTLGVHAVCACWCW